MSKRFDKNGVPLNQKALDRLKARWYANIGIDPESIAGTPVPVYATQDPDDDFDADIDFAFDDIFDQGEDAQSTSKIWSGVIVASYTGIREVERVEKHAVDVIAMDEAGAKQVVRNLYNSCLAKDYPTLHKLEVMFVRDFKPMVDKDKRPHLVDPRRAGIGWMGGVPIIKWIP